MRRWNVFDRVGPEVNNPNQTMGMFLAEAYQKIAQLQVILNNDPMQMEFVEQQVKELFDLGAGLCLTGMIANSMNSKEHDKRCEETRLGYAIPLRAGHERQVEVHLGAGHISYATTLYCQPKSPAASREEHTPGLDIDLSQYGFSENVSPWLVSKVCRTVALAPSLDQAYVELRRDGIQLTRTTIDRIVSRAGSESLTVRERMLEQFERGEMKQGCEFTGRRVSVQIDGGRTRTRGVLESIDPVENFGKTQSQVTGELSAGRSKETRRSSRFQADWREPKLLIIYAHDDNGRRDEAVRVLIDGSFGDADYMERLISMHLHRLGANKAKTITFNSDGATWIWGRIDSILAKAKVESAVIVNQVLDVCHAVENLGKALQPLDRSLNPAGEGEPSNSNELRSRLRDGQWSHVVEVLTTRLSQAEDLSSADRSEIKRVIEYIRSHGEARRLDYPKFKLMGLPLGSGSIESAIRRVINLRMKNSGTFWRIQKAEKILTIRSSILSGRWDDDRTAVKYEMKRNRKQALPKLDESPRLKSDARQKTQKSK